MNQRYQKRIFVQVAIYTNAMMIPAGGVAVIPENTFSGACYG
jgi:hypothetical protein